MRITCTFLALMTALTVASPGRAQHLQPFGPVETDPDLQLFAPADLGEFGQKPPQNEGFWASYERLLWTVSPPDKNAVGYTGSKFFIPVPEANTVQSFEQLITNTVNTAVPYAPNGWGNRFELGYVQGDPGGWMVSVLDGPKGDRRQLYGYPEPDFPLVEHADVAVVFKDPFGVRSHFIDINGDGFDDDLNHNGTYGRNGRDLNGDGIPDDPQVADLGDLAPLRMIYNNLRARNATEVNGVELMRTWRCDPFHRGGVMEWFLGARYMVLDDLFAVDTEINATPGLHDYWHSRVTNYLVGPQVGMRFTNQRERWTFTAEGRGLAAVNIQNIRLTGNLREANAMFPSTDPQLLDDTAFIHTDIKTEFSPVAEMRVGTSYQFCKAVSLNVGWTGMYMGGISRASNVIEYSLPQMGLKDRTNRLEDFFTNGISVGVEVNR